eukprot:scaffold4570_cov81-Cylindrotheca_fusiformis.AAC.5
MEGLVGRHLAHNMQIYLSSYVDRPRKAIGGRGVSSLLTRRPLCVNNKIDVGGIICEHET